MKAQHFVALVVLTYSAVMIQFGERLPVADGYGWDGVVYARLTKNFYAEVFVSRLDAFRLQRIVPCGVVHYGLRLTGLSTTEDLNIQRGFQVYNAALLVLSVYLWAGIAGRLNLSQRGLWLGWAVLFLNFPVLKLTFYAPVLTDTTAIFCGLLLVYGFLAERLWITVTAALIGAFAWPAMLPAALSLIVFPRSRAQPDATPRPLTFWLCAVPGLIVVALAMYRWFFKEDPLPEDVAPVWTGTLPLAVMAVWGYLTLAYRVLIDRNLLARLARPWCETTWQRVAAAIALAAVVQLAVHILKDPHRAAIGASSFFKVACLRSLAKPAIFLVAHAVYFGPLLFMMAFAWPQVCRVIRKHGLGVTLTMVFCLLMSITSESRHLLCFIPLLVAVTIQAIDTMPRSRWYDFLVVATAILASKIWFPINQAPFQGPLTEFPYQYYFMNQGPWMSGYAYAVQGSAALVVLALFGFLYVSPNSRCAADATPH